jgi:CBS domain-containing protein
MRVQSILLGKGHRVATIRPGETVAAAVHQLKVENVGSLVVSADGRTMLGLVTEREILRALCERGPVLLAQRIEAVMHRDVPTCAPQELLPKVMAKMSRSRSRYVVVLEGDRLAGIVSIGDVLSHRLHELEAETRMAHDAAYLPHVEEDVPAERGAPSLVISFTQH